MNGVVRVIIIALALALACLVGWRVVVTGMAHLYANDDPERALAWDPHQPAALLARAEHQLADHQPKAAAQTARALLRREPLQAQAFRILGAAADAEHDTAHARIFYTLAVRYAPRDPRGRSWIINDQLRAHRYSEAMSNIDIMLRTSPGQGAQAFPIMADLAVSPEFARALAHTLSGAPLWREGMLDVLLARGTDVAVNQVHAALQTRGGLSPQEAGRWVDRLLAEGHWGEAYSYWVSGLALAPGASLPLIYNGGFETEPTGTGFDWRIPRTPGVVIERVADSGATGSFAMHLTFLGSRVPRINFEQRLFLAPGNYRLDFRARAQSLHSDVGLQWMISCDGKNQPVLTGTPIEGSFDWKKFEMEFTVPAVACGAQRLYFHNPGSAAAGTAVSGDLWLDDMVITPSTP
jgi:hypothetical protein